VLQTTREGQTGPSKQEKGGKGNQPSLGCGEKEEGDFAAVASDQRENMGVMFM